MDLSMVCLHREVRIPSIIQPIDIVDFTTVGLAGIKHIAAAGLWRWLRQNRLTLDTHTIVMESSGNAGVAMAQLVIAAGLRMTVVVSHALEVGKITLLKNTGAEVVLSAHPCKEAHALGQQPGHLEINQYVCPGNSQAHKDWTGPRIAALYSEHNVPLPHTVICSTGSTGTLVGLHQWRRDDQLAIHLVAARPEEGSRIPGARTRKALANVNFDWPQALDQTYEGAGRDAYHASQQLINRGYNLGPSTGLAAQAVNAVSPDQRKRGRILIIGADMATPYLSEYQAYGLTGWTT